MDLVINDFRVSIFRCAKSDFIDDFTEQKKYRLSALPSSDVCRGRWAREPHVIDSCEACGKLRVCELANWTWKVIQNAWFAGVDHVRVVRGPLWGVSAVSSTVIWHRWLVFGPVRTMFPSEHWSVVCHWISSEMGKWKPRHRRIIAVSFEGTSKLKMNLGFHQFPMNCGNRLK